MVIDNIENKNRYLHLHSAIRTALLYIETNNITEMSVGKYEIEGDRLFLLVQEYDTRSRDTAQWETHKEYLDLQYVSQGTEEIGWSYPCHMQQAAAYDKEKDAAMWEGDGMYLPLKQGDFVLLYPGEPHMPQLKHNNTSKVKKAVFKIKY